MKAILTDAAAVGNATARAIVFATRDPEAYFYEDSAWKTGFIGGSHEFERDGVRLLDPRTPLLLLRHRDHAGDVRQDGRRGLAVRRRDGRLGGQPLRRRETYRLHFPPDVPAKDFWSLVSTTTRRARCCRPTSSSPA